MTLLLTLTGQLCLTQAMEKAPDKDKRGSVLPTVPVLPINVSPSGPVGTHAVFITPRTPNETPREHTRIPHVPGTYITTPRKIQYVPLPQDTPREGGVFYESPRPAVQTSLAAPTYIAYGRDTDSSSSSDSDEEERSQRPKRQRPKRRECLAKGRQKRSCEKVCRYACVGQLGLLIPYICFLVAAITGEENAVTKFGAFRWMCGIAYNENMHDRLNTGERVECALGPLLGLPAYYWAAVGLLFCLFRVCFCRRV